MSAFDPKPRYDTIGRFERMRRFAEYPAPWEETFDRSIRQNFADSFGIGTLVRELTLPPLLTDTPQRGDTSEGYATRLQTFQEKALSQEAYQASPFFRNEVPWEKGLTEDRAAALAAVYDQRLVTDYFSQKRPLVGFAGAFVGQAFDPVNYIPIFGQGAHIAAVAKAGSIFGRAGIMSAEATVNTAIFSVLTADLRRKYGEHVSFESIATEIGMSALIGGVFGTGLGFLARGADARAKASLASMQASMDVLENKVETRAAVNQAIHGLATKGVPDVGQSGATVLQRIAGEVVRRSNEPADVAVAAPGTRAGEIAQPTEIALLDGYALDTEVRAKMRGDDLMAENNADFRAAFLNKLPIEEQATFRDKDGNFTPGGQMRLRNAVVSHAFAGSDPVAVQVFSKSSNPNNMEIVAGMADSSWSWAQTQRGVKAGNIDPALDPAPMVSKALATMNQWRDAADKAGWTVAKTMKLGMSDELLDPATKLLIRSLFKDDNFTVSASRAEVAAVMRNIADVSRLEGKLTDIANREMIQNATGEPPDPALSEDAVRSIVDGGEGDGAIPAGAAVEGGAGGVATAAARAAADARYVGGLSIQQSLETQGKDFVPTDKDMADLEGRLEDAAKVGGVKGMKALSTEGRYGGVERSVDLEATVPADGNVGPLWRRMLIEAENAKQDSVFLARELDEGEDTFDPMVHRPAIELTFATPKSKKALEAELAKLAANGVEFLTVTVGGKPARRGAMPKATGIRIFYMPEFDRRYGMGPDLKELDDAALYRHMQDKAMEMQDLVTEVSGKVEGVTGRVGFFEADVAFSGEYRSRLDGIEAGVSEGVGRTAGSEVWRGQSVREGLEGADRQLKFVEDGGQAEVAAGRGPDQGSPEAEVAGPAPRAAPPPDFERIANEDINFTKPIEDPPPEGLAEAAAAVGKVESLDDTAKAYGVDPENGTFDELDDIKQIKEEGRLTEEDQAELDLAEQQFNEAKAYDKALQAAMRCVI